MGDINQEELEVYDFDAKEEFGCAEFAADAPVQQEVNHEDC